MSSKRFIAKQGERGTAATRRMQRCLAKHILALTKGCTKSEAAKRTGLTVNDIKNLRAGNMPSLRWLICLVRFLRVTPESVVKSGPLDKLPDSVNTRGAQLRLIRARMRHIARSRVPAELADESGLAIMTIYIMRGPNCSVGLHSYLAFVDAGYSASELLLGC